MRSFVAAEYVCKPRRGQMGVHLLISPLELFCLFLLVRDSVCIYRDRHIQDRNKLLSMVSDMTPLILFPQFNDHLAAT